MKELKNTAYSNFKATVIASRDQLCIHPKLKGKSNTDKILMCKNMMDKNVDGKMRSTCEYYQNIDETPKLNEKMTNITDIEDLGAIGRNHKCCPYYITKQKSIESDVIFIPYSYLIDPIIRDANDIDLKRSIIIIDEAHNVNRVCEDSASASIKDTDISAALKDLNAVLFRILFATFYFLFRYLIIKTLRFQFANGLYWSSSSGKEDKLKRSLQSLKEKLVAMQTVTKNGGQLFELLKSINVSYRSKYIAFFFI